MNALLLAYGVVASCGLLVSAVCLMDAWRDWLALRDGNGLQVIAREAVARNTARVVAGALFLGDVYLRLFSHQSAASAVIREVVLVALSVLLLVTAGNELRDRLERP